MSGRLVRYVAAVAAVSVLTVAACSGDDSSSGSSAPATVETCIDANGPDLGSRINAGDSEAAQAALQACGRAMTRLEAEGGYRSALGLLRRRIAEIEQAKLASAQHEFAVLSAKARQQCAEAGTDPPDSLYCEMFPEDAGGTLEELAAGNLIADALDLRYEQWAADVRAALGLLTAS